VTYSPPSYLFTTAIILQQKNQPNNPQNFVLQLSACHARVELQTVPASAEAEIRSRR
jgi:hypothetical protein